MREGELRGWTVAVLGGDTRMLEHMRLARAAEAIVKHYGSVPGAEEAAGRPQAASLAEAVKGARIISCPIPGIGEDDAIYARYTSERLKLTTDVLMGAAPGAFLFTCWSTPQTEQWAKGTPVRIIGYANDDALAILHAVPTAEGAVRIAIENTDETILGMHVLCIGFGRVGTSVAQAFDGLKARVTLAARNPAQLARAAAMGLEALALRDLAARISEFPLVVSSASGKVLDKPLLERTRADAVIIDLCSPPGSIDFDSADALGRKVIWARAQAGRAPKRAGRDEWQVLMRILREQVPELQRT